MQIIQMDFHHDGPFGAEQAKAVRERAESIAREPELIWKVWTENPAAQRAGGVYLFTSEAAARAYATAHEQRLAEAGATDIQVQFLDVNETLSVITHAPLERP